MSDNWNTESLFAEAQYREVETDGAIASILFTNESYLGVPTGVFAYMGIPETAGESVPGIVCVHGGGARPSNIGSRPGSLAVTLPLLWI